MINSGIFEAIVGLTGSGKSVATEVFQKAGFEVFYFGQVTMDILKERGLEVNEANEKLVRESLRQEKGMDVYAVLNETRIAASLAEGNVVVDGLYSWEERQRLLQLFPQLRITAVFAPPDVRYDRLSDRKIRPLTREQAAARDIAEIEKLHKAGPIAMADQTFLNDGSVDKETLIQQIELYVQRRLNGEL